MTTADNGAMPSFPTTTTVIVIIAVTVGVLVLLLCSVLSMLVLCRRCNSKHKKQYHLEEKETRSSPDESALFGEVSPPESQEDNTRLQEDEKNTLSVNDGEEVELEDIVLAGNYSSLYEAKKPEQENSDMTPQHYAKLDEALQPEKETVADALYSSVDEVKIDVREDIKLGPHPQEEDASIEQVFTQKKSGPEVPAGTQATGDTPVDQLYAQVDKKQKNREVSTNIDIVAGEGLPTYELYAQVNKKSKEPEDSPQESGRVYAVVNKPKVPAKSESLLEDLQGLDNL